MQQARELRRHELPDGDLARIVERALDLLIADRMKRRFGVGRKPRAKQNSRQRQPSAKGRYIPLVVRREVVARDQMRCCFVSSDGRHCAQRSWLQLHHEDPYGRGGPTTTGKLRFLCQAHNQLLAERDYGRSFIKQRIAQAKQQRAMRQLAPETPEPAERVTQRP